MILDHISVFAPVLLATGLVYGLYRRYTRVSVADIPGPKSDSFLLGNLRELYQGQAGEADFKWQRQFGDLVRIKSAIGDDVLLVSDPKALQYMFQTSGYNFPKQKERRVVSRLLNGPGIVWADGDDHKRQRKVMLPGFGGPESKAFVSVFRGYASQLSAKWMDIVSNTDNQSAELNVPSWLSRATLDAIGDAAFGYHFGSVQDGGNFLAKSYSNLMSDIFGLPSAQQIFFQSVSKYLPMRLLDYLGDHGSSPRIVRMRDMQSVATGVAKDLVKEKAETLLQGKNNRDVFGLLVKANMAQDAKTKLTEEELLAQMRTVLFAGHETTSNTVSWALLELARNPKIQDRLRAEIRATEVSVRARGDSEFTIADFDAMPYTIAVMKEVLRFHPVAYHVHRYAGRDDVLPLSRPMTTVSGKIVSEVPIPKGIRIIASIAGYNRNKDVWGEDAHTFNPDRWLTGKTEKKGTSVGVYGNLMTFLGGIRSCIGWRFAVVEIQAFLIEMVNNFEFSLTEKSNRIRREACLVMVPTVEGEVEKGVQMPLSVSIATRDD
ncbi:hypothetical protein SERLA73DRAFT_178475 [Serpula lacrymans var. lacrymans S7.3]|uniref:Cytochrome P450 n=2 Tax=Serpula lacrymans var. lacrymans TaxID=341189 RepID=F8PRQ1_SERL3|nr:uncharacterized protein SERLADRAFT_462940 [Serpula lacrymans var. lacrymans S7.9]EGO00621.1 hypothetical protein SERLA73DRAFT_178475 [Serpula lacrymans var. lacrymans S7.3]EGO26176.1 hypothetical protein SERLADRAFT_462940 [Serpula lacrymans var. lacrymans S7.9]